MHRLHVNGEFANTVAGTETSCLRVRNSERRTPGCTAHRRPQKNGRVQTSVPASEFGPASVIRTRRR